MKHITITILLTFAILAGQAQELRLIPSIGWAGDPAFPRRKCGTWEPQPPVITEWATVDTIGKKDHFGEARDWKYSEEQHAPQSSWTNDIWRPCGFGDEDIYEQFRVCSLTGIRQKRQRIISYKYIDPPRSEYERVTDSLYATVAPALDTTRYRLTGRIFANSLVDSLVTRRFISTPARAMKKRRKKEEQK